MVSAEARKESRGAHVRDDAPDTAENPNGRDDANWLKHTLWYSEGDRLDYKPVNLKPLSDDVEPIALAKRTYERPGETHHDQAYRSFKIYRYDPDKDEKPYMQDISVELEPSDKKLLDALVRLRAKDDSMSFRRSCREGVCGSDAMNINGKNGLACLTDVDSLQQPITLRPLPGLPVIRDLIVDMTQFFKQYHSIKPYW